jgi:2,4-dienoyl-CoA reductase-like NADH-dependent reductase (Old Yellow Enzyme family)
VPLAIQIGHAGRKASTQRPWEGRGPLGPDEDPWETLSPMGEPLTEAGPATRAMTRADMDDVIAAHVEAARRAVRLGFSMIELHGGHGYLLSSFLSPLSNRREDTYGGSAENRMRFPLEVVRAVRDVVPADRALAMKYNGTDWAEGGLEPQDAPGIAIALADAGVDMVTLTGGGVVMAGTVPVGPGYQLEAAQLVKAAGTGMVVGAVGMIYDALFANDIVATGQADVVSIARAMLDDPRWPRHAAATLGHEMTYPPQYDRATPKTWRPARPAAS